MITLTAKESKWALRKILYKVAILQGRASTAEIFALLWPGATFEKQQEARG